MSETIYIVRELDHESQTIRGVYRSLDDARARAQTVAQEAREAAASLGRWGNPRSTWQPSPNPVEILACVVDSIDGGRQVELLEDDEEGQG